MDPDKFYVLANPWFGVLVAKFIGNKNFKEGEFEHALIYRGHGFLSELVISLLEVAKTDRNGNILCDGDLFKLLPGKILLPTDGLKIEWAFKTPWAK